MVLDEEFEGEDVVVTETRDAGITGNFEVTANGQLIHSKTSGGKGRCESASETKAVIDAIRAVQDA